MEAHKELVQNGIPLDKVVYITYGIEIGSGDDGWGSLDDFTIFTAAQFEQFITQNTGKLLPRSNLNNIHGFCTGMLDGKLII
jgi:hypothetical protein